MGNSTYQVKGKGGKLKNRFLRPRKVQGKYRESAGKQGGNTKIHFQGVEKCRGTRGKHKNTLLRPRKVQGNWEKTQNFVFKA